jgi:outer membrane lipoprotein-sorting protein
MLKRIGWTVAIAVAGLGAAAWADTLESVEKAIVEKVAGHKSYQGKTVMSQNSQTPDMKYESQGEMTFEFMKKGEKWLLRSEGSTKTKMVVQGNEQKSDSKILMICDGEFMYTLNEGDGQKSAMKTRMPEQLALITDQAYFDSLAKDYTLKLVADETVDGKSCWVIEATPKTAAPEGSLATLLNYFDKETGIGIKTVGKDSGGKTILTSLTTDIKLNPTLSPDRFVFKAPEGVQVVDMSQSQTPPPADDSAKAKEEPKKAEESKKAEEPKKGEEKPKEKKLPLPKLPG